MNLNISFWNGVIIFIALVVLGVVVVEGLSRRKAAPVLAAPDAPEDPEIGRVFDWVRRVEMSKGTSGIFDIEDPPENWFTEVSLALHQHEMLKSARNRLEQARGALALFEYDLDRLLQVASEQPTEQERCVALAEYLRYACDSDYVANYVCEKRSVELTAVRSELTTLVMAQMDEMVAAAATDRKKFLLVLLPFIDSRDERGNIMPYTFDDYASLGVELALPEEWNDMVARYLYAPSARLFYSEPDIGKISPGAVRQIAADALHLRDLTIAKMALAYCDVVYMDEDTLEVRAVYRDAIGPVMMRDLSVMVSKLHDMLGLNFDPIEPDVDNDTEEQIEAPRGGMIV